MMYDSDNRFLSGNYAPFRCEGDELDLHRRWRNSQRARRLAISHRSQSALSTAGAVSLVRGDGMVHGFTLRDGKASYRNRYVKTAGLAAEMRAGKSLFGGLAEKPKEIGPEGPFKNAANTNIIGYANRLLALWEAGLPHELKPGTPRNGRAVQLLQSAQWADDGASEVRSENRRVAVLRLSAVSAVCHLASRRCKGNLVESHPIDTGLAVMMHDFVTTDNYAIFFVCPSVFRFENVALGKTRCNGSRNTARASA